MDAARFVVDVQHAAADHHRDVHGQGDGGGKQELHVVDVGIEFDDLEGDGAGQAGLDGGGGERRDHELHFSFERAGGELVGVIGDEADDGRVLRVDAARILGGDDDRAVDFPGAHVFANLLLVLVVDGGEGFDVDGDGIEGLAEFDRLRAVVVIDDADACADDFASEGVAHDDQLHEGHHQGHDHQGGRAEELAHLALDDGEHSAHGWAPGLGGMVKAAGLTCSSRSWRPV